jgi:hypothetical protein
MHDLYLMVKTSRANTVFAGLNYIGRLYRIQMLGPGLHCKDAENACAGANIHDDATTDHGKYSLPEGLRADCVGDHFLIDLHLRVAVEVLLISEGSLYLYLPRGLSDRLYLFLLLFDFPFFIIPLLWFIFLFFILSYLPTAIIIGGGFLWRLI